MSPVDQILIIATGIVVALLWGAIYLLTRQRKPASVLTPAQRGAQLLDRYFKQPRVWARAINTETLDMVSLEHCILGQLFGSFRTGLETFKPNAWRDGFMAPSIEQAAALKACWLIEIDKRREG